MADTDPDRGDFLASHRAAEQKRASIEFGEPRKKLSVTQAAMALQRSMNALAAARLAADEAHGAYECAVLNLRSAERDAKKAEEDLIDSARGVLTT